MSPLTDRSQAKEGGYAQAREAMQKFAGDVTKAEWGQWGGKLVDDDGKPVPPKEFLEVQCENVEVLESVEEISVPTDTWNFRVNTSDFKGSFWVERFLESADRHELLIPDGMIGKRITFQKVTLEAKQRDGTPNPKFNSTNYVIAGVGESVAVVAIPKAQATVKKATPVTPKPVAVPAEVTPAQAAQAEVADPMEPIIALAVGKTEAQFRTAIGLDSAFAGSPLLPLAKSGLVTQSLVNEGRLVVVALGNKQVYSKPN